MDEIVEDSPLIRKARGNVLKALRSQETIKRGHNVTQSEIAEEFTLGRFMWHPSELSRLEKGRIRASEQTLSRLCEIYNIERKDFQKLLTDELSYLIELMKPDAHKISLQPPDSSRDPLPSVVSVAVEDQPLTDIVRGRDDDLEWLKNTFFPETEFAVGKRVAVTGLGGMGKTTLALEYARSNRHRYTYRFFCLARSKPDLTRSYRAMAERLQLDDADVRRAFSADTSAPEYEANLRSAVKSWLQRTPGYLLILDNADLIPDEARRKSEADAADLEKDWLTDTDLLTEAELEDFLPQLTSLSGHLLMTTRNAVPSKVFGVPHTLHLEELLPDAAEDFLMERTQRGDKVLLSPQEREALAQLVAGLCGLPLALEQAGAYIYHKGQRFATYLKRFASVQAGELDLARRLKDLEGRGIKRGIEVLEENEPELGRYASTVAKTWLISFGAVKAESKAAAEAFTLSAFLDPDAAPAEVLRAASALKRADGTPCLRHLHDFFQRVSGDADEAEVEDHYDHLFEPLMRYSLVTKNTRPERTFRVHRLVQAVRRRTLTEDEWQRYYSMMLETYSERVSQLYESLF